MTVAITTGAPLTWEAISWKKAADHVRKLQIRIAKAFKAKRYNRAKALQWLMTKSLYAKLLAIKRVSENQGKNTPGIDCALLKKSEEKMLISTRLNRRGYKASPLKRIYIPKKNGKLRPLGIPTMLDRCMQALYLLALEPIAETTADRNSCGFRPKRSLHDAITQCFIILSRKGSAQWILEGDIKACFDKISHEWMLQHIPMDKTILEQWLKAGFIEKEVFHQSLGGTPQGGIASPTLANMVLDGLEQVILKLGKRKDKLHFVRYADDWICTASSREILEAKVLPAVANFLKERDLELSLEKTKISHIKDGFDFLGTNIRKYGNKLLIKPTKKGIKSFLDNIRETIYKLRGKSAADLIKILNPKIQGWTNHYKHIVSKKIFSFVDHSIWKALWQWAKRRHPNKNLAWRKDKYFVRIQQRDWLFYAPLGKGKILLLKLASDTSIVRHVKIQADASPYDPEYHEYFKRRTLMRMEAKKVIIKCRATSKGP